MNLILRRLLVGAGAVLPAGVVAFGAAWLYFVNYSPDRVKYPVRGIDVSHHQGVIDWSRVAADDVSFAIIKASEGGDYVDDGFAANLAVARDAGLAVVAYHFFTLCRPGAEQAANFLAVVPRGRGFCRRLSISNMKVIVARGRRPTLSVLSSRRSFSRSSAPLASRPCFTSRTASSMPTPSLCLNVRYGRVGLRGIQPMKTGCYGNITIVVKSMALVAMSI